METKKKKERYEVELLFRSLSGNPCSRRRIINAYSWQEAEETLRKRIEKYKYFWKFDSGTVHKLNDNDANAKEVI